MNYLKSVEPTIGVNPAEVKLVEAKTIGVRQVTHVVFRMHSGRITASRFKSACHTDPSYPSLSLIMSICHPETKTASTCWGCEHESTAHSKYVTSVGHETECGLFISSEYPFIGASPDGLVNFSCSSDGVYEINTVKLIIIGHGYLLF